MCWAALDRGIRLAYECLRKAPVKRWEKTRNQIREAVEAEGYDEDRGIFVQAFTSKALDAALLLIPSVEFVPYDDERMVRTVDAIRKELEVDGLLLRYRPDEEMRDGLEGEEGAFLACSFWLAECLARQGRIEEARVVFDRAASTDNEPGLFSEEYDTKTAQMLGNFPQGLTHIAAAVALAEARDEVVLGRLSEVSRHGGLLLQDASAECGAHRLEAVMNLGENRIEMRIPRSAWFPRDLCFPHS
jgi:GH15 family glucan-1,4-alpha-glucosidase